MDYALDSLLHGLILGLLIGLFVKVSHIERTVDAMAKEIQTEAAK